jgi:hypothetical protein
LAHAAFSIAPKISRFRRLTSGEDKGTPAARHPRLFAVEKYLRFSFRRPHYLVAGCARNAPADLD